MAVIEESDFTHGIPVRSTPRRKPRRAAAIGDLAWNVMTVLVWLLIAFTVMAFATIYTNPSTALNPFRPADPPMVVAAVAVVNSTPAPQQEAALVQPSPTATETSLPPTPTATAMPTEAPADFFTPGPSPTATVHSLFPFIQRGEMKVIDAATFPDHDTCRLWVAGQAYDLQSAPMVGITVMLGGSLDYKSLYQLSLTGTALQYGQAGYEFTVSDAPKTSKQSIWVQLFDQAMIPLSNRVYFDTAEDCSRNLILINFRQVR